MLGFAASPVDVYSSPYVHRKAYFKDDHTDVAKVLRDRYKLWW